MKEKTHSNMVAQKEDDNSPATEAKDTEYCNLTKQNSTSVNSGKK